MLDDDFVTEPDGFKLTPRPRRASKPPASGSSPAPPLSKWEFTAVWLLLLTLHALCAAFLLAKARLYWFLENPLMAYYTNLLALPKQRYFRLFGAIVGVLGALHALQLLLHLYTSIRARVPMVWPRAAMVDRLVKSLRKLKKKSIKPTPARASTASRTSSAFQSFQRTIYSLQEVLSVEGKHFALVFMLRKAVEASAQIVQCHRFSSLIAREWINHAYVTMVITNCWVTPLLDRLMLTSSCPQAAKIAASASAPAGSSIRERTLCVSVDTLLTTCSCLVLPLAIFVPYARVFDPVWYGFPMEMLYSDTAFPNLILENQALFALNFLDGLTKLVPHLSVLLGLASISLLLEEYPPWQQGDKPQSLAVRARKASNAPLIAPKVAHDAKNAIGLTFLRRVAAPLSFVAAGAVVLGLHLHAQQLVESADAATMQMCRETIRPWFAVNVSCSILEYNCHRQGVVTPAADALDHLQNDAVTAIVFEHCAAFEMPPSIRRFPNLLGLELWNMTIVSWGPEAALNAVLHPKMIYLVMVYVNMTEMPQGLLQPPLPELLADIEIACTNLTKIPAELAEAWANVRLVFLEHTPLLEFPTPLFQIPSLSVSLLNDGLTAVPDHLFTSIVLLNEFLEITLSYNPITTLPEAARENLIINYLSVDHTELSTLPAWTGEIVDQWLNLGGAPICNDSDVELSDITSCYDAGWDPIGDGRYPLYLVAPFREL